ncbi:hypothetical protein QP248_04960 [Aerococcus sp. UMB8608]|nr:hypothetical protein [Aerococcus sp. UMB8608]MDK6939728.1 hypothetical protein [Aerococcus sp. UMB8487]
MRVVLATEDFEGFSLQMTTARTMDVAAVDPMIKTQAIDIKF